MDQNVLSKLYLNQEGHKQTTIFCIFNLLPDNASQHKNLWPHPMPAN